MAAQTQYIKPR